MLVQRSPAALWLMKTGTIPMEITNEGVLSFQIKLRNVELYLKEATVVYCFYPLAARLLELLSNLERLDCSHLLNSEFKSKFSTDYSSPFKQ